VVAHNTYTELAAEAGLPAIFLFLLALGAALKNVLFVKGSVKYQEDPEIGLFTQALRAGLLAYIIAACFASTEYNLYPYFLIGYTCAMVRIVGPRRADKSRIKENSKLKRASYDRFTRPQPTLVGQ